MFSIMTWVLLKYFVSLNNDFIFGQNTGYEEDEVENAGQETMWKVLNA